MSSRFDPDRSIGFLMHDVARLMRRDFNRRAGELGLTQAQWLALAHLVRNEGINQTGLADLLEITPITVGRLVDRLEAAGLVERRPDPADRRAVRLHLTAAASPVMDAMWAHAAETRDAALAGLSPDTIERMLTGLQAMRRNLTVRDGAEAAPRTPEDRK